MSENKKTICLSMIVKNEESCIARCLNSLKKHIDYWVICDTGSTDNTKQVILETLAGIPGEIIDHQWVDFATNRNLALEISKQKADYSLIIDADDKLVIQNEHAFDNLTSDAYRMIIRHGSIEYCRPQLISNKIDYKYCGVLHEYIELPHNITYDLLEGLYMQTSFDSARSRNPNKFIDDAKVLEEAVAKEPNNTRYVFYLAQSYRDSGMHDKAAEWYQKRADMGGWQEEAYVALLEVGKAKERMNSHPFEIESAWLKATYSYPIRAEALYHLARYFRSKGMFNKAYAYIKDALSIPKPREGLFLEEECYAWRMLDELSILAYYVGAIDEGRVACEMLLKMILHPIDLERIRTNYHWYLKAKQ